MALDYYTLVLGKYGFYISLTLSLCHFSCYHHPISLQIVMLSLLRQILIIVVNIYLKLNWLH